MPSHESSVPDAASVFDSAVIETGPDVTEPDTPPPPRRRRHGRFRRWVVRPLFWSLASLAMLFLALRLVLDAPWTRNKVREVLVSQLTHAMQREVTIDEVEFELLPLTIEIRGFTIVGPTPEDPPFLHVPFAAIDANLDALQHRRIHLHELRLERPTVYLEYFLEGGFNYPRRRRDGDDSKPRRGSRSFEVHIDRLEIDEIEFALDHERVRLSLASDDIKARFRGLGDMRIGGQLVSRRVTLWLPNARPIDVVVSTEAILEAERLDVTGARIDGDGVSVGVDGTCEWTLGDRYDRKCLFQARGNGRGRVLEELGYFRDLAGAFGFNGSFAWRPGATGWRSRVFADRVDLWGRRLEGVDGSLVADRYGVRSIIEQASYAGGEIRGEVLYEQREEGRPVTVDLDFEGVSFDTLLADQEIPSQGYASRADGKVFYRFESRRSKKGDGNAEVTLRVDPQHDGVSFVSEALPLRIDDGVIRAESVSARSDRQSILASGWFDLETNRGEFDYEIASVDLPELTPLLPLAEIEPVPLWLPTGGGQGEMEGTLYLAPDDSATDMRLSFRRVETPSGRFETVQGDLFLDTYEVASMRLELGDGDQALMVRGRMPYEATDEDQASLVFGAFSWPLEIVRPWLEFDLLVDGFVSGRMDMTYGAEEIGGRLTASVRPASLTWSADSEPWVENLDEVSGRLEWDSERIYYRQLEFQSPSGTITGHGHYDWTTEEVDLDLRSAALEVSREPLRALLPRQDIRSEISVEAHIAGPLIQPRLEIDVEADELAVGDKVFTSRPSRLSLASEDGVWQVDGRLLDMVTVAGGGLLDREQADLAVDLDGNDLAGLLELLFETPPMEVDGTFKGSLQVFGSPPEVALELDQLRFEAMERALENLEPVVVRVTPERLLIDSFFLGEEATGSEFLLTGEMGWGTVAAEHPADIDLFLQSSMATSWLDLSDYGFDLDGTFDLLARISGPLERPEIDGQGELREARLVMADFPYPIEELGGLVTFYPDSIVLERLGGKLAGGSLELTGVAALDEANQLDGYRLHARGDDLRMLYPEGWTVHGDTELTVRSTDDGVLVDGRAELDQLEFRDDVRFDVAELMRGFLRRQRLEVEPADSLLSSIGLNVDVDAPQALRIRNNLADLTGSADLSLRGDLAQPVLYGAIEVDPGGTVVYNSTEFEVDRGRLDFVNPYRFDPEVDLVLTTEVRDFDISLDLSGTFERLDTRFASEPPLPDLEVFRLLATGDITPQTTVLEPRLADTRTADRRDNESTSAATFLYGQAAAVIGERFNNLFGFDKFRIDPLTGSGDNLSKTRLTVGKRLSKDFFLTYSLDPSSTEEPRWQVEWQVSQGLVLVLTQNGDSTYSADARWESSF